VTKKIRNLINLQPNQLAVIIDVELLEDREDVNFSVMPVEADDLEAPDHVKFFLRDMMRAMCAVAALPDGDLEDLVRKYYATFIDYGDDDDNIIPFPTKH
jgi:hypothetical protein|tara:strand:+ start:603 stop:902 length:300 start_codon:yes stop_codon:yes gene_type:complete